MKIFRRIATMLLAVGLMFGATAALGVSADAAPRVASVAHFKQAGPYDDASITVTVTVNANGSMTLVVSLSGFEGKEAINIYIHSVARQIGTLKADAAGDVSGDVTVPAGYYGSHIIEAVGQSSGVSKSFAISLPAGPAAASSTPVASSGSSSSGSLASTGAAVIGIGALAVILLAGGGAMLYVGRRRQNSSNHRVSH